MSTLSRRVATIFLGAILVASCSPASSTVVLGRVGGRQVRATEGSEQTCVEIGGDGDVPRWCNAHGHGDALAVGGLNVGDGKGMLVGRLPDNSVDVEIRRGAQPVPAVVAPDGDGRFFFTGALDTGDYDVVALTADGVEVLSASIMLGQHGSESRVVFPESGPTPVAVGADPRGAGFARADATGRWRLTDLDLEAVADGYSALTIPANSTTRS